MSDLYRQLCNLFIRPTRQQYSSYDLGSPYIQNIGRRKDFDLKNSRGLNLKCSFFEPLKPYEGCIVYLHSLNGSRLQSCHLAKRFLSVGVAFANLDMSGSGHSEGEYVSLGFHERLDAKILIEHIHANYGIKLFGIWGRSMGAVTALNTALQLQNHPEIVVTGAVLDSPYFSLMDLALEIADRRIGLPSLLVKAGMLLIKSSIEDRVKFRLDDLEMKNIVKYLRVPLLILASKQDELINWHHSQKIYNEYISKDKELLFIKGSHSSVREQDVMQKIVGYLQKNLKVGEHKLKRNLSTVGEPLRQKQIITVKSSENIFSQSVSPVRKVRSITPSYIVSRQSLKLNQKRKLEQNRYKTQKTIYQEEQNYTIGISTNETEQSCHMNIISQKLLKMRPKNIVGGIKKFSESKPVHQDEEISPRKGMKIASNNTRLLKLKKKPNIAPALLQNNKLNHNPYLTNANLVKLIDQQDDI